MKPDRYSRWIAIALSVIPGWGHIYLGREGSGLIVFTLFAVAGFAFLNATLIYLGELAGVIAVLSLIAAGGLGLYGVIDVVRSTSPARLERVRRLGDRLLWEGMLCFLRSDYLTAEQKFLDCSRLEVLDVEPIFRAGVTAARRGAYRQARRLLLRARALDTDSKWRWEIGEELERVARAAGEGGGGGSGRGKATREAVADGEKGESAAAHDRHELRA